MPTVGLPLLPQLHPNTFMCHLQCALKIKVQPVKIFTYFLMKYFLQRLNRHKKATMTMFTYHTKRTSRISWHAGRRKLSNTSISGMQCNLLAFLTFSVRQKGQTAGNNLFHRFQKLWHNSKKHKTYEVQRVWGVVFFVDAVWFLKFDGWCQFMWIISPSHLLDCYQNQI